jgi:aminoglycoside phosphotransferase (APT) family kinase protein
MYAVAVPELAGGAAPLLARVEDLAGRHPADPAVPAHRSFRPAQVLLADGRIGFIDFDGICQAEPAIDVALFLLVKGVGLVESLAGRDVGQAAWEEMHTWTKVKPTKLPPTMLLLARHLAAGLA